MSPSQKTSSGTSTRPIRVLHVIPQLGSGGAERVVVSLLNSLDATRFKTRLCVLGNVNSYPAQQNIPEKPIFLGYRGSLKDVRDTKRCLRSLRSLIREGEFDIVHSHLWPAARIVSMTNTNTSAEHIVHIHARWPWVEGHSMRDRFIRFLTRHTVMRSKPHFIAVSKAVKEYHFRHFSVPEKNIHVIPNGIDPALFSHPSSDTKLNNRIIVGMVARFSLEKGHQYLIRAIDNLVRKGMDIELRLAGEGALLNDCIKLAQELNLSHRIRFVGLIEEIHTFYRQLDIFVLPSLYEGLPNVVLEAMATGLPVVATSVDGTPELIVNGKTGYLVPSQQPQPLAVKIKALLSDTELARQFGRQGRQRVEENFSLEKQVNDFQNLYEKYTHRSNGKA